MNEIVVSLHGVTKKYGDLSILNGVDLEIRKGEFLTLLGPSGCGKTTILKLVAGFEFPTSGEIRLNGRVVNQEPPEKREVNTVFQSYALFPHMSIFDNVAFGPRLRGVLEETIREDVKKALEMVQLSHLSDRRPHQLSGGQQQRIAIARAVINKPSVLLLDESLSALDYKLRKQMQVELKQLQRQLGITFVFVTHDQEEALSMSDRIVLMHKGVIQQIGTPTEIYESPANLVVANFIGEATFFDSVVVDHSEKGIALETEGQKIHLKDTKTKAKPGSKLKILVRPEDLRVERFLKDITEAFSFEGVVEDILYRGTVIDLCIRLKSGHVIQATEFYNEDSDALGYKVGQTVFVTWVDGWEVLLEDA
ncbi:MAG: spermidine/putrescine ABC transporter ATP-binding protein PotA [Candidatus Cloacimonetes bacterium]|nr:spermidine/putrescine ABC transporter ATP-binding protein PotA [Candidatus Cloacimonadota bacterium]